MIINHYDNIFIRKFAISTVPLGHSLMFIRDRNRNVKSKLKPTNESFWYMNMFAVEFIRNMKWDEISGIPWQ